MVVDAALTQVLSVGVLWISFHCAGMCGPIVGGVVGGRATSVPRAVVGLLLYQLGRMVTLGVLGAVAGATAATVDDERVRGGLALVFSLAMLASLLPRRASLVTLGSARRPRGLRARVARVVDVVGDAVACAAAAVDARVGRRPFVIGAVLGFLPCMIVAWGLSLAAATGTALAGARVMVVLVAMTSLPLLFSVVVVAAGSSSSWWRRSAWLRAVPVVVSAVWLFTVGLAGLGVLEHRHVVVDVFGPRTVMLW
jgi:sulfite exporter TauE/SafE